MKTRSCISFALAWLAPLLAAAEDQLQVLEIVGAAEVRAPGASSFKALASGASLESGSRVKTPPGAKVRVRYPDGSEAVIEESSDAVLEVGNDEQPSSSSVFFGRIWAKVAHATGGASSYEVRTVNAVAGVRGTVLVVGSAFDATGRLVVDEGDVLFEGDEGSDHVNDGESADASGGSIGSSDGPRDWAAWFATHAKKMETDGLAVAKNLKTRLEARKRILKKLLDERRELRREIQAEKGTSRARAERFIKLNAKIASMRAQFVIALEIFREWAERAASLKDGPAIAAMLPDIDRLVAQILEMIDKDNADREVLSATKIAEAARVSAVDKKDNTEKMLQEIRDALRKVTEVEAKVRSEGDMVKLACVQEKLSQIKGLIDLAESSAVRMYQAMGKGIAKTVNREYTMLVVAHEKSRVQLSDANACRGKVDIEEPTETEETTAGEKGEEPDPTEAPPDSFGPVVPPVASPF
ncbi:MAG: FecR domain-containing protein [Deltaproteobacteria bacterium]|nr:FecR domain-containing protein [Deltaproteobacteria bacterium]